MKPYILFISAGMLLFFVSGCKKDDPVQQPVAPRKALPKKLKWRRSLGEQPYTEGFEYTADSTLVKITFDSSHNTFTYNSYGQLQYIYYGDDTAGRNEYLYSGNRITDLVVPLHETEITTFKYFNSGKLDSINTVIGKKNSGRRNIYADFAYDDNNNITAFKNIGYGVIRGNYSITYANKPTPVCLPKNLLAFADTFREFYFNLPEYPLLPIFFPMQITRMNIPGIGEKEYTYEFDDNGNLLRMKEKGAQGEYVKAEFEY